MNHDPHASPLRTRIDFAQASDPGRDPNKQVNEDSCGYAETRFGHLAVLCDGMGGHYGGKEASRTAITTIFEVFEQLPAGTTGAQALKIAIEEAGRRVYQLGGPPDNRARPGSTVVAMLLSDRGLDVAHVGDSRAYIIRSNQIYPLTRDHSMVQGMIDAGMLTEETAMGHPDSNKITRALGMRPDVDVELRPEIMEVFPGDLLLQSSDGLTDLALGRDILGCTRQALASGGVENACNMLVRLANDRGGHDNITVQIVRVTEVAPKVHTTIPERPAAAGPAPTAAMPAMAGPASYPPQQQGHPQGPVSSHPPAALAAQGGQAHAQTNGAWAPVAPTIRGLAPAGTATPSAVTPTPPDYDGVHRPTLNDPGYPVSGAQGPHAPQQAQQAQWAATAHQGAPTPSPAPALASYRVDAGAAALPLPPAGSRPGVSQPPPAGAAPPGFGALTPTPPPGGYTPAPGGYTPAPYGQPLSTPPLPVSRGGIVFVILGLSGVIAVLILVVVWALWLRG